MFCPLHVLGRTRGLNVTFWVLSMNKLFVSLSIMQTNCVCSMPFVNKLFPTTFYFCFVDCFLYCVPCVRVCGCQAMGLWTTMVSCVTTRVSTFILSPSDCCVITHKLLCITKLVMLVHLLCVWNHG